MRTSTTPSIAAATNGSWKSRCPSLKREFYEVGVDGVVAAGDDGDVVEAVRAPHLLELGL